MPRNITLTFEDGSTHVYQNAPDEITPEQVMQRAAKDYADARVIGIDGGRPAKSLGKLALDWVAGGIDAGYQSFGKAMAPANEAAMRTLGALPPAGLSAEVGGGRGNVNPPVVDPNAAKPKQSAPYRDRREALDDAVNMLDEGLGLDQVSSEFAKLGISKDEIVSFGRKRGSEFFTPSPDRAATPTAIGPEVKHRGEMKAWEPGVLDGAQNIVKRTVGRAGQAVTGVMFGAGVFDADQASRLIARDERKIQGASPDSDVQQGMQEIGQAKSFGEAAKAMALNPRATATMLAESVLLTAPAIATTVMGLPAKGMAAVVGANSMALEFGGALSETLSNHGVDLLDTRAAAAALQDPAIVKEIRERGAKRGLTIGAIDALTAGFAGKFIAPAMRAVEAGKLTGSAAKQAVAAGWAKELGMQVSGGAGGEAIAGAMVGEFKPADILLEGVGEMVSAPLEAHSNLSEAQRLDPSHQIASAIDSVDIKRAPPRNVGQEPRPIDAWEIARSKGFHVEPILSTDRPSVRRGKAVEMFRELGALAGIPGPTLDSGMKAAERIPADELPGFFSRFAKALQKRGLVGGQLDPDILRAMETGRQDARSSHSISAPEQTAETIALSEEELRKVTGLADDNDESQQAVAAQSDQPVLDSRPQKDNLASAVESQSAEPAIELSTNVDAAAHQAATSPTNDLAEPSQGMKEAGNYKVGRTRIAGMDIRIENPQGSKRRGVDEQGNPWETEMKAHYGYFAGTEANDGDKLDVFVRPGTNEDWSGPVYVVDQIDPKTGALDEHKVIFGAKDEADAEQIYRSNYDANWQGLGAITRLPMPVFKAWAKSGRLSEPLGDIANAPQLAPNRKPAAESLAATSEAPQNEQKPSQAPTPAPAEAAPEKGFDPTGNTQAAGGAGELGLSGTRSVAAEASRVSKQRVKKHPSAVRGSGALAEVSRSLGGISPDLLSDLSEKTTRTRVSKTGKKTNYIQWDNPAIPGVGPLFRKGGTSDLSEVARVLEESGYLEPGSVERDPLAASQRAHEIIRGELREGGSTVRVGNADAIEAEMRARMDEQMDEQMDDGPDPWDDFTLTPEDLEESGYYDLNDDVRAATEQLIAEAEQLGIDTESIREDMARLVGEEASQDEYHAATQEAIRSAITEAAGHARQTESSGAGTGDRSGLEIVGQTDREGSPVQDRDGGSDQEGLNLQSQTEADLRQKAQREQVAAKAEATKKAAEQERLRKADEARDNKARADATVEAFELGQSADAQLSGMADLFGDQETTKQTTKDSANESDTEAKPNEKPLITDVGEKIGGARKDTAGQGKSRSSRDAQTEPGWRRRYVAVQSMIDMTKEDRPWHLVDKKTGKSVRSGYQVASFPSQADAEAAIPLIEVARNHRVTTANDKGPDGSERFVIMRDVSDRKRVQVVAQDFESRQEAMQYLHDHAVQIIETRTSFGEEILPKPENAMRTGAPRRVGDAKGEDFIRDFGLRAVEFGNWNNQDERQEVMNHAYDALADLADIIGIPSKAIGLNGQLGLAFGARGQGLSGARAHYEVPYGVINLTKMSGAGSLGHEWFHALDHYFARQDGKTASERTANQRGDLVFDVSPGAERALASSGFKLRGSGVRQEVRDAYETLIKTMFKKAETYVEDAMATERFVGATKTDLSKQLQSVRDYLSRELDPKYYKRLNKPATAEQLAAFDTIAEQLIAGEGLATSLKLPAEGKSRRGALGGARWTNDALEQISAIIKSVRGVTGFRADRGGMLDTLRGYLSRYEQRLKLLAEAQAGNEKQRSVPTAFAMEAKSIDQGRASDYWSSPHEMAARAFEAYVTDKVAAKGNQSDFLAYGTNSAVLTPWGWKRPYPSGAEREEIGKAFDRFLSLLETKTDESGNVALFSTVEDPSSSTVIDKVELDQIIDRNLRSWRGIGVTQVVAAESWRDLPEEVLQEAERLGFNLSKIDGSLHRGRAYLVRSAIKSREQAERIVFHEVLGHLGVKAALGGQTTEALDDLWYRLNGLAGVAKIAKKHEAAPGVSVWQRLQPYIKGTEGADQTYRRAVIMDELIAYLAQAKDTSALTQFKGYLSDLKSSVVKLLRRFGLETLANKLERAGAELDALALVRDARASIMSGKTRAGQQFVFVSQGQSLNPAFSEVNDSNFSIQATETDVEGPLRLELSGETEEVSTRFSIVDDENDALNSAMNKAGLRPTKSVAGRAREVIASAFVNAMAMVQDRTHLGLVARQSVLDQFTGIDVAVRREIGNLPVEQDPYVAARLANGGTSSVMRGLLLHGKARWAANGQHLEMVENSKGLLDILAPLGDDLNNWFAWMIGNRAARLAQEGRENLFTAAEIAAMQKLADGRKEMFVKAAMQYADFKKSVLDVAEGAGLLDPDARKAWDHADYIPFYRQIDERSAFSPTGRKGLAGQSSGVRTLKGGTAELNDPIENLLMNFSRLIDASLKNNALLKTVSTLENTDVLTKVGYEMKGAIVPKDQIRSMLMEEGVSEHALSVLPESALSGMAKLWSIQAPSDPDVIRVMRAGKPQYYRVNDPLLLQAVTSFVPIDFPGLDVARWFKRTLTHAITSTPEFMLRNYIRDTAAAAMISRDHFKVSDSLKGIAESYTGNGASEAMLFAGASFQSGNVNAADPTATAVAMRRALRKRGLDASSVNSFMGSIVDVGLTGWEKYREIGEAIENANREAVFKAAIASGGSVTKAAFESKDLMDFNLRGSHPIYQVMADTLPFLNARVQGLYRLGRADPKRLVRYGVVMMVGSLMLAAVNGGEDWYEELPDWDKDSFWHVKVGGHHFRIPKPFELGVVFSTIPERIMRFMQAQDSGNKTAGRLWAAVRDQLAFDVIPQVVRPALNIYANHDPFRDSPIEGMADEGKLPHLRYDARTSETAKALSGLSPSLADYAGASPKRLEYLVGAYFGTIGTYALSLSDMAVRSVQNAPEAPSSRLDDYPVIKAFYRVDPARATVFESDFWKVREEVEKVFRSVNALKKSGDQEQADELARDKADELGARAAVQETAKKLGELTKMRNKIYLDRTMSAEAKRQMVDALQVQRNKIVKSAMEDERVKRAAY